MFLPGLFVARFDPGENPDRIIHRLQEQLTELQSQLDAERGDEFQRDIFERIRSATTVQRLVSLAEQVRALSSCRAGIYETLAIALRRFDRVRLASEILRTGLTAHPGSAPLLRELGFCERLIGHLEEAQALFQRALDVTPRDTELLGMLGGFYKRAGEMKRAREMYERAIAVDPDDLYPLLALCGLLVLLNEDSAALSHYRSVLVLTDGSLKSGHVDHWMCFARTEAYLAQKDLDKALEECARAMALNPPPGDIRSEREQLELLRQAGWRAETIGQVIDALGSVGSSKSIE